MTIDKLYALNEEYYRAYARLKKNAEFLTDKQYKIMADSLSRNYQNALQLMTLESDVTYKRDVFKLKRRIKREVPWSFLFFKNREAKLMQQEIEEDYDLLTSLKESQFEKSKKGSKNENTGKV